MILKLECFRAVVLIVLAASSGGCKQSSADASDAGADSGDPFAPLPDGRGNALRGRYLVDVLLGCGECHTPRNSIGVPIMEQYLSGQECWERAGPQVQPADGGDAGALTDAGAPTSDASVETGQFAYCLHTRNLTSDATGLKDRTDDAIKHMFLDGVRPTGQPLNPAMPYYAMHNMRPEDADAVVAYLRSVPPIEHRLPESSPAFRVDAPAVPLDPALVPAAPATTADRAAAERGRYIASLGCITCHTRPSAQLPLDASAFFAGGRAFPLGAPPPLPPVVYSANLTQAQSGLLGYTTQDIVQALKMGRDKHGKGVCPPMPTGPQGAFGYLQDSDAIDIATYILTLAPIENVLPNACELP